MLYRAFTGTCNASQETLQWRHNEQHGVSNHQPHDCLLSRLFRRRSKKTSQLRATGLCAGIHRWPVNSSHKGPITRKMFPFDDVIMDLHMIRAKLNFVVVWHQSILPISFRVNSLTLVYSCPVPMQIILNNIWINKLRGSTRDWRNRNTEIYWNAPMQN